MVDFIFMGPGADLRRFLMEEIRFLGTTGGSYFSSDSSSDTSYSLSEVRSGLKISFGANREGTHQGFEEFY